MEPRRLLASISDIQNQVTNEDFATSAISFTVSDASVPLNQLTVSGTSSNSSLVQDSGIVFGGSGAKSHGRNYTTAKSIWHHNDYGQRQQRH